MVDIDQAIRLYIVGGVVRNVIMTLDNKNFYVKKIIIITLGKGFLETTAIIYQ
jgi:hypothetical protein